MVQKFRKKPVLFDAVQWTGKNQREVFEFLGWVRWDKISKIAEGDNFYIDHLKVDGGLIIKTREGGRVARIGDFIVKGEKGDFFPCNPIVFVQTHEQVES